jgi:hypothetical protein
MSVHVVRLLTVVAWSDCIRCICIPRRRTLFAFSNLPGEPAQTRTTSSGNASISHARFAVAATQSINPTGNP